MTETTSETNQRAAAKRSAGARAKTTGSRGGGGRATAAKRSRGASAKAGPADRIAGYAERAVLIPVGAALIARDRLVDDVGGVISDYSSPAKAQAQLRRFERRGESARGHLEREARRTRTRLERTGRALRDGVPLPKRIQDRLAA